MFFVIIEGKQLRQEVAFVIKTADNSHLKRLKYDVCHE